MNENLARWTAASINVYFKTVADTIGLTYFVEGVDERDSGTMLAEHAELRLSGPFIREVSNGYWRIHVDVNVMLTDQMKMSTEGAYDIHDWGGAFLAAMLEPIPVYRLGAGVEDDDSLIGCLTQRKGFSEPVRLIHFGQVSREDRIRQAVVDGRFEMYLSM
ncbi:MAG: hypothetical protein AMS22_09865 [Thiotrichales bacterium SG8_50]|nr:MAG: hypothetical protein AMS22_09865 [Thiotrichales bacterium SG8_50]